LRAAGDPLPSFFKPQGGYITGVFTRAKSTLTFKQRSARARPLPYGDLRQRGKIHESAHNGGEEVGKMEFPLTRPLSHTEGMSLSCPGRPSSRPDISTLNKLKHSSFIVSKNDEIGKGRNNAPTIQGEWRL